MKVKNLLCGRNGFSQLYEFFLRQCSQDCSMDPKSTKKSPWGHVQKASPDPILSINQLFLKDKHSQKVNLSMGVYRDDNGKPLILPSVVEAEKIMKKKYNDKEYSSFAGMANFNSLSVKLLLGDDSVFICKKRNATVQTVGGTGSLHIAIQFLSRNFSGNRKVYLSKPTCPLISSICQTADLDIGWYRYYCSKSQELDFEGCLEDVCRMTSRSIIYLQCCGHDPTGVDLTQEQWCELSQVVKKRKLYPLFDVSNQGLATGNIDDDSFAVRLFAEQEHALSAVQSFSRNMGIYSERVGLLTFIAASEEEAEALQYHLEVVVGLTTYISPIKGARIVTEVLGNANIRKMWLKELEQMTDRMKSMRVALKSALKDEGSVHNWDCIIKQKGIFCYTSITEEQVKKMATQHHIYMTTDGRISVPGINKHNLGYVAKAMHQVTK